MNNPAIKFFSIFVILIGLLSTVNAVSLVIQPTQGSTSNLGYGACGSQANLPFTITNNGYGGALCWYTTSQNPTPQKLTPNCITHGSTSYSNALLTYPSNSGTQSVTVQLDCFDFYDVLFGSNTCVNSYTYEQARTNKYSEGKQDTNPAISPRYASVSCSVLQFSVTPASQTVTLYTGQSQSLSFTVNNPTSGSLVCTYAGDAGSGSLGTILPSSSQSFSVTIQAPNTAAPQTKSGQVTCLDSYNQHATQPFTVSATVIQNPAKTAIDSATNSINSAISAINSANSLVSSQTSSCIDTTSAQNLITQAQSQLSSAQTSLQNAESTYQNAPYDPSTAQTAVNQANDAQSKSEQAKNFATQASTQLQTLLSQLEQKKQTASSAIHDANNTIQDTIRSISTTDSDITVVSNLGADTTNASNLNNLAKQSLSSAQTDYGTAQSEFNSCAFDQVSSVAASAKTKANQAKEYTTQAYNSAETARSELQQLIKHVSDLLKDKESNINSAQSWIDRAVSLSNNETLHGIDLVDPETKIKSAKADLDNARTYYSQAQDAFSTNRYALAQQNANEAQNYSMAAETDAKSAFDQLNIYLEKAKTGQPQLDSAQTEISKAEQLYNKLLSLVGDMQNYTNLSDTLISIQKEKDNLNSAKDLLSKAQNAHSAGAASDTINYAVQSRDTAATSYNRLDDIVLKLSGSVIVSLNDQLNTAIQKETAVQQKITDASATFGASTQGVISAQDKLKQAKQQLSDAQVTINKAKNDTDLLDQLGLAKQAFVQLNTASQTMSDSMQDADNAKLEGYAKVGGGGAIGVAAIGGGFMWWKRKKNPATTKPKQTEIKASTEDQTKKGIVEKEMPSKNPKPEEETSKERLNPASKPLCKKCGTENLIEAKFCHSCGLKFKKQKTNKKKGSETQ
ncbi:MAG: hypothetical protein Q7S22_02985 [Candidatus Micrarchaeota archaeon]|nr:hypothetical protein [Candidatus Micrarchaeota archaeon]